MSAPAVAESPAGPVRPRTRAAGAAPPPDRWRPSYGAAALAALAVLALYAVTLAPTTAMWDASEYITAAHVLGIPHPPGNPFFVLLGHVATRLPVAPDAAMRVNALAAACSALAAGVWFLVAERVVARWLPDRAHGRVPRLVAGALAALIGATAFTVWNQSVVNEKVYTVSLAFFAVVAWLVVRWCDDPEAPGAGRLLVLAAYLVALGYTNHPAGFLVAPAVATGVVLRRPRVLLDGRLLVRGALAFALGLTPFAVLPIRAAHHPPMNQGEISACPDGPRLACTFSGETWRRLAAHVGREQYAKPPLAERQAPLGAQFGMWWQYFRWQWLRDAHAEHGGVQAALAAAFLALGLVGGWVHLRRDRPSFWFFGPLVLSVTVALVVYMNFKYGATQAPALGDAVPREVRDRDYFYLWSFSTWGVWAALGLVAAWRAAAGALGKVAPRLSPRVALAAASPVLALALAPLVGNWRQASRAGQRDVAAFARDLLNSVEPYGVLLTYGDNDTFPLWYAQEVEGVRRDVTVVCLELLNTEWYARQLARRRVAPYDATRGPAVYRDRAWPAPTAPLFALTNAELDAVPLWTPLDGPQRFERVVGADTLRATIARPQLLRADVLVLHLLKDGWPARPLHVARSTGDYAQQLGLGPYLLTQGLARKVLARAPVASRDTLLVPEGGALDVRRSLALWRGFGSPEALASRADWVDPPSVGIPNLVTITGLELSAALAQTGRAREARQPMDTAVRIARVTRQAAAFGLEAGVGETLGGGGDAGR